MKRLVAGFGIALVMVVALPPGAPGRFGDNVGGQEPPATSVTIARSGPWDQIDLGSRKLVNNQWGAHPNEHLTSGVYLGADGRQGWFWSRPNPKGARGSPGIKPIYPGVRVGGNPWEASKSGRFPIKVGDVRSLTLELTYSYASAPTGSHNLAYDIFLTPGDQPATTPVISAEVMVWLRGNARQPFNSYKGDFSDGRNTYKLHSWVMDGGRLYYAFVLKGQAGRQAAVVVDARRLLDGISLDPGLYIHGVELGNEVWHGAGRVSISDLVITINGVPA